MSFIASLLEYRNQMVQFTRIAPYIACCTATVVACYVSYRTLSKWTSRQRCDSVITTDAPCFNSNILKGTRSSAASAAAGPTTTRTTVRQTTTTQSHNHTHAWAERGILSHDDSHRHERTMWKEVQLQLAAYDNPCNYMLVARMTLASADTAYDVLPWLSTLGMWFSMIVPPTGLNNDTADSAPSELTCTYHVHGSYKIWMKLLNTIKTQTDHNKCVAGIISCTIVGPTTT